MVDDERLLTSAEFGRELDPPLTPAAVRLGARDGRFKPHMTTASGIRLFSRKELRRAQRVRSAAVGTKRTEAA